MPGFPQAQTFVLIDHRPGSVFRWFQSADVPDLAFVVIDPLNFVPDFPVDTVRRAIEFLDLEPEEDVIALVICTVPAPPAEPTGNFLAPLAIGVSCRKGAQVVLHDSSYTSADPFLARRK